MLSQYDFLLNRYTKTLQHLQDFIDNKIPINGKLDINSSPTSTSLAYLRYKLLNTPASDYQNV